MGEFYQAKHNMQNMISAGVEAHAFRMKGGQPKQFKRHATFDIHFSNFSFKFCNYFVCYMAFVEGV
jgi:hypothetical protein